MFSSTGTSRKDCPEAGAVREVWGLGQGFLPGWSPHPNHSPAGRGWGGGSKAQTLKKTNHFPTPPRLRYTPYRERHRTAQE